MIKILNGKAKHRRIGSRVNKLVWRFGLVWEAEIYSRMSGKDGRALMEKMTGDTIEISEWTKFETIYADIGTVRPII